MYLYLPFKEVRRSDELGSYTTYGIRAVNILLRRIILTVPDVSTDQTAVSHLCYLCMLHDLQPVHLLDVIIDYIS